MRFDVVGGTVTIDPAAVNRLVQATADDVLPLAAQALRDDEADSFTSQSGSGSNRAIGEIYIKHIAKDGRATVHQASAPGQPPAVDTGTLRASIAWTYDKAQKVAIIGTPVEYAPYLEFGTNNIAPRPSFRPVVYKYHNNDKLVRRVVAQLRQAGRGR